MNRPVRHALQGVFIASLMGLASAPVMAGPAAEPASAQALTASLEKQALVWLSQLDGKDYQASLNSAAAETEQLLDRLLAKEPADLEIAVGPTGVLVGTALHDDPAGQPEVQRDDLVMLALAFQGSYRILQPNEVYHRAYEDPELLARFNDDDYYDGSDPDDDDDDDDEE